MTVAEYAKLAVADPAVQRCKTSRIPRPAASPLRAIVPVLRLRGGFGFDDARDFRARHGLPAVGPRSGGRSVRRSGRRSPARSTRAPGVLRRVHVVRGELFRPRRSSRVPEVRQTRPEGRQTGQSDVRRVRRFVDQGELSYRVLEALDMSSLQGRSDHIDRYPR